jgi:hypothetical protein
MLIFTPGSNPVPSPGAPAARSEAAQEIPADEDMVFPLRPILPCDSLTSDEIRRMDETFRRIEREVLQFCSSIDKGFFSPVEKLLAHDPAAPLPLEGNLALFEAGRCIRDAAQELNGNLWWVRHIEGPPGILCRYLTELYSLTTAAHKRIALALKYDIAPDRCLLSEAIELGQRARDLDTESVTPLLQQARHNLLAELHSRGPADLGAGI